MLKILLCLAICLPIYSHAQEKRPMEAPRAKPGRDGVMVLEQIPAGGCKRYNVNTSKVTLELLSEADAAIVDVSINNKPVLTHSTLSKKAKTVSVRLAKKATIITVAGSRGSSNPFVISAMLTGGDVAYHLNLTCNNTLKDTIIINKH